jgi:hypothetical protein
MIGLFDLPLHVRFIIYAHIHHRHHIVSPAIYPLCFEPYYRLWDRYLLPVFDGTRRASSRFAFDRIA